MKKNNSSRISRVRKSFSSFVNPSRVTPVYLKTTDTIKKRPILSLVIAFGILLAVMIVASIFTKTPEQPKEKAQVKSVSTYSIGESPTVTLQAQIEKKGVITITALSGGVVNRIPVTEGQTIQKGQTLVQLATNYNGASLQGVQTQLARTQYNNVVSTYDTQKDIVKKQREITEKTNENTEELRKINDSSLQDTRTSLNQNERLLNDLNQQIEFLESSNGDPEDIAAARQTQAQLQSGVNQIRSSVRNLEYQTNKENPPTELANIQRDLALKQLEVQEKSIDLNKDVSKLQLQLAAVSESLLYPSSPFDGVVERVHVQVGQSVAPGTVLATISKTHIKATAVLNTPRKFALSISQIEPTILMVKSKKYELFPDHISGVATTGQLYSVIYSLPNEILNSLSEEEYISLEVPIGFADTSSAIPFVPIDAVYQGQDSSYVNILNGNKVGSQKVELGSVYGKYVEITSGLTSGDHVILDRTVISGDTVQVTQSK